MKKILLLLSVLLLSACANDSYKIDSVATAKARWKAGEEIPLGVLKFNIDEEKVEIPLYRVFYGISEDGRYVIQDFHADSRKKYTNHYQIAHKWEMHALTPDDRYGELEFWRVNGQRYAKGRYDNGRRMGEWTWWYENGQKRTTMMYQNGELDGPTYEWHSNGQKKLNGQYAKGYKVGIWHYWDETGDLIEEKDYETPESLLDSSKPYDEMFVLKDQQGKPIPNFPYKIVCEDGKEYRGRTNEKGETERIYTDTPMKLFLYADN